MIDIIIRVPDEVGTQLHEKAVEERMSVESFARFLLEAWLNDAQSTVTPEAVVAKAKSTPPNPTHIRHAEGSLALALQGVEAEPPLDVVAWNQQWERVEMEMKKITHANRIAEGLN